jgi:hypothetical protein
MEPAQGRDCAGRGLCAGAAGAVRKSWCWGGAGASAGRHYRRRDLLRKRRCIPARARRSDGARQHGLLHSVRNARSCVGRSRQRPDVGDRGLVVSIANAAWSASPRNSGLAVRRRARSADCIVARFFWDLPPQRQLQAVACGFDVTAEAPDPQQSSQLSSTEI